MPVAELRLQPMAEKEALAQVIAEAANLKASGVSQGRAATETRAQVTPGMDPGQAARIGAQNTQAQAAQTVAKTPVQPDLLADLKKYASPAQGQQQGPSPQPTQAQAPAQAPAPATARPEASKPSVAADLKQYASPPQGQQPAPAKQPDMQPKR